ncbi:1-aminocyclopropane-1-carboxylate deaminase/D-cysteine desulfhydrase [Marinomonas profundimaris]|uniref:D-cysteine desulfhydrase n=1 Tax=Marinomonas profundimaris TaxID=1208321 RepID=W1RNJ6_9GAMM|nr:D-cysteine desulfhydrase [Marinomonas profundimaris]ETI57962.1 D-cysteine desulfhydrase [Marinomonas profundimaris]
MAIIQSIVLPPSCLGSSHYELAIYRGDLEHPDAPGNKWHKLQHHIKAAKQQNATAIATFGGPFSNHLHAFGSTLASTPFKSIAVVRGELQPALSPTLKDLANNGVELWPSSRSDYRLGTDSEVTSMINVLYDNIYWIPEGGGGLLGALGCRDWAQEIDVLTKPHDAWVVSAGTGTTAAGLLAYSKTPMLHVVSALKGAQRQKDEILNQATNLNVECPITKEGPQKSLADNFVFHCEQHEGGYAKRSPALNEFMVEFANSNPDIPLDPVYTCKSMFGIFMAMEAGTWPHRRTLFIHTGGLQGWRGYSLDSNPFVAS